MKFTLELSATNKNFYLVEYKSFKIGIDKYKEIIEKIGEFDIELLCEYVRTNDKRYISIDVPFDLADKSDKFKQNNELSVSIDSSLVENFMEEELIVRRGENQVIQEVRIMLVFSKEKFLEYWEENNFSI